MLCVECALHLGISKSCSQVDSPVAEAQEELLGLFVATVNPGITQSGIHLVYIIKRYPCAIVRAEVSFLEVSPNTVAARHTTHIAFSPFRMVLGIGIGTSLQLADKVLHTLLALFVASSSVDSHRCKIVSAYMSVKSVPVGV